MLTVLGGLAEFERELIRARTGEGRVRAKARACGWAETQTTHHQIGGDQARDHGDETCGDCPLLQRERLDDIEALQLAFGVNRHKSRAPE